MIVEAQVTISGTKAAIWSSITNIANAAEILRGVEQIEVVAKPPSGLVGLKWRETRLFFGKPATVEKWITESVENEYYRTRAEDGGFAFLTTMRISEARNGSVLQSIHETKPLGLMARLKGLPMVLFRGVLRRAILQDLDDYKSAVEQGSEREQRMAKK